MTRTGNGVLDKTKGFCVGCHNDFYNGKNDKGIPECWSYETAELAERFKLGWWTEPNTLDVFEKVWTLSCHIAPGDYALMTELPKHLLVGIERLPEHLRVAKVPA